MLSYTVPYDEFSWVTDITASKSVIEAYTEFCQETLLPLYDYSDLETIGNGVPAKYEEVRSRYESLVSTHQIPSQPLPIRLLLTEIMASTNLAFVFLTEKEPSIVGGDSEAPLFFSMYAIGVAEMLYQHVLRTIKAQNSDSNMMLALDDPEARRILLAMKSVIEGGRALIIELAEIMELDIKEDVHEDYIQLAAPVLKSYITTDLNNAVIQARQIIAGSGCDAVKALEYYIQQVGMFSTFGGLNTNLALDLVETKLPAHTGRYLRSFFHPATEFVTAHRDNTNMAPFTKHLHKAVGSAQQASLWVAQQSLAGKEEPAGAATTYINILGLAMIGLNWAQQIQRAQASLEKNEGDEVFCEGKVATGRFFMEKQLPQHYSLLAGMVNGVKSTLAPAEEIF